MKVRVWLLGLLAIVQTALADDITPTVSTSVKCGDAIEGEFTQPVEVHEYIVSMSAGDKLKVVVAPIGDYLSTAILIYEPAGNFIVGDFKPKQTPVTETGTLSARGDYKVYILNYESLYGNNPSMLARVTGRAGTYTVLIGCTLRDGTVIEAGSSQ
jgi:hypothetical protein